MPGDPLKCTIIGFWETFCFSSGFLLLFYFQFTRKGLFFFFFFNGAHKLEITIQISDQVASYRLVFDIISFETNLAEELLFYDLGFSLTSPFSSTHSLSLFIQKQ